MIVMQLGFKDFTYVVERVEKRRYVLTRTFTSLGRCVTEEFTTELQACKRCIEKRIADEADVARLRKAMEKGADSD